MAKRPYDGAAAKYGKKIDVYTSRAIPGADEDFDVRLDSSKGVFATCVKGEWITSRDLKELHKAVDARVAEGGPTSWEYYIKIHRPDTDANSYSRGGYETHAKLVFCYDVTKLSNVIRGKARHWDGSPRDVEEEYRLEMEVRLLDNGEFRDGNCGRPTRFKQSKDETLVVYTPERWAALGRIAAAIDQIGEKLGEFVAQDQAEAFLARVGTGGHALLEGLDRPVLLTNAVKS